MKEIIRRVMEYYQNEERNVPWRKDITPYHIWLSEIMCQQTRMETVIPYYYRFIQEVETIEKLAEIDEDQLMKLWQGLGYYSRARNLQKAAKIIVEKYSGFFPNRYEEVLALPGIGEYSAGAIMSIAYNQKYAAVDGNVLRVLSRVKMDCRNVSLDITKKEYKKEIEAELIEKPGDFNQGIMDIGAQICLPHGQPLCGLCPLKEICQAHRSHCELDYPIKDKPKDKKIEHYTVLFIVQNNKVLIHKRDSKGLLANLYEFKNETGFLSKKDISERLKETLISIEDKGEREFIFTHKIWKMKAYRIIVKDYIPDKNECFVNEEQLRSTYSLPSAFSQFIDDVFVKE